jgi:hypothetical protein
MDMNPCSPQTSDISISTSQPATVTPGEMKDERIDIPCENDVLCGRGGSINSHKGNEQFRDFVEKRKRVYLTARFKREKRLIASSIVTEIRQMDPPGRFLARKGSKDHGWWYDIGDEKARDKTSQALRENAPSIRAEIETEINIQRREMKQQEEDHAPEITSPTPASYPPPPHGYPYPQQSYWDWYYQYYGYPPPPPPPHAHGHYPPPPHASPTGSHPPPPPPPGYWGHPAHPPPSQEEYKEDIAAANSTQEDEDHLMAVQLQHQEKDEAYDARRRRHQNSRATSRPNAFVSPGSNLPSHIDTPTTSKTFKSSPFNQVKEDRDLTQEEKDHRLAVALQEEEDKHLRLQIEATGDTSRRTSRSNAFSQVTRVNRDAVMHQDSSYAFEQMVPSSFVAWVTSDTGQTPQKPKAAGRQRLLQFMDGSGDTVLPPPPPGRDMAYSPINLHRQSSVTSETRPLQPQAEPNSSLLSQVAHHILGSWETNSTLPDSKPSFVVSKPKPDNDDIMETEGQEVQLDVRDESCMPPPEPRVQIDWPSRVGSCHSWLPESLGVAWAGSTHRHQVHPGISPVNSLEMDGSATDHSFGGGSLCHVFETPNMEESMHRALSQVPSWERSMRSKSPLSIDSGTRSQTTHDTDSR